MKLLLCFITSPPPLNYPLTTICFTENVLSGRERERVRREIEKREREGRE